MKEVNLTILTEIIRLLSDRKNHTIYELNTKFRLSPLEAHIHTTYLVEEGFIQKDGLSIELHTNLSSLQIKEIRKWFLFRQFNINYIDDYLESKELIANELYTPEIKLLDKKMIAK